MIRFAVYDREGLCPNWPMVNPYLLGPEDVPVKGRIVFREGYIECKATSADAMALCVMYEAETMGHLMLQTCLLPPRKKPYILSVELARHRIKLFITKMEEWQMFDLSAEHPALRHWEEARRLFTESITTEDPLLADQAARYSLIHAIEASERLALAHADVLLHRRFGNRAASSATLGVRIRPGMAGPKIRDLVAQEFDVLVVPIRWKDLEAKEGKFTWGPLDAWMDWTREAGKPIIAGPLLDFSKAALPEWMNVWKHDFDACRDQAYDYIEKVVYRYKGAVSFWNVASGLHVNDNFEFTSDQMVNLTRMVSLHVRESRKGARTMIELVQPFGEYRARNREAIAPLHYVDRLTQEGIRFDALGVQLLFGSNTRGMNTRDIMQISNLLDRFFLLETPILVSAMGVPSMDVDNQGGWWRHHWDPATQAKWITQMFAVTLSKPFVESVFWTDLIDHEDALLPGSGLVNTTGQLKPSFRRLCEVRKRLRKPLGKRKLPKKPPESS